MKKYFFISTLFISLFSINLPAISAEKAYISISQSGSSVTIKWKYNKTNPKGQKLIIEELALDNNNELYALDESIYKLSNAQRNKKILDLKLGVTYNFIILSENPSLEFSKKFRLLKKPSTPTDLDYHWNNNKPEDKLSLFWKYSGEKVDNWIITVYKSNIILPEDESTDTLEDVINQEESEIEVESIIKRLTINGSSRKYNISELKKSEGYRILIEGKNKAGVGIFNNFTIEQSAPNEVFNLKVEKVQSNNVDNIALNITWEYAGPDVESFSLGIRAAGFKEDLKVYKISPLLRSYTINNLSKGGYYQFVIKAINENSYTTAITEPFLVKIPKNTPKDPLQEKLEEEAGGSINPTNSEESLDNNSNNQPNLPTPTQPAPQPTPSTGQNIPTIPAQP
jgi:hypothetical protein